METPTPSESIETFQGSATISVRLRSGAYEIVQVRELSVAEIPAYAAVLENEARAAELFCAKPQGWAESLSRESLVQIVEKGEELNLPFTVGWMQRKARRDLKVAQSLGADVSSLLAKIAEQVASRLAAGSQTSPSPQGTPQPNSAR